MRSSLLFPLSWLTTTASFSSSPLFFCSRFQIPSRFRSPVNWRSHKSFPGFILGKQKVFPLLSFCPLSRKVDQPQWFCCGMGVVELRSSSWVRDHLRVIKQIQEAIYLDVFVILHLERHFKTLNKQVTCPRQKGHFYKSLETFLNPTQKHHSAVTPALQTNTRQRHFQSPVNGQMTMTNNEIPVNTWQ